MRIDAISGPICADRKQNFNPKFNGLIRDKSALPIIEKMSKGDILEFEQIEQRVSKTKFWDLKLSCINDKFNEFKFYFINKKNKHEIITDGIHPYNRVKNKISVYSIVYGEENTYASSIETLKFKSEERAKELMDKHNEYILYLRNRGYNITPIEALKMKELELNMLEEAAEVSENSSNVTQISTTELTKSTIGNELY